VQKAGKEEKYVEITMENIWRVLLLKSYRNLHIKLSMINWPITAGRTNVETKSFLTRKQ
jgi:hypothetical protein